MATFTSAIKAAANLKTTTLVVGATGDTGKHVVRMLLEQEQDVKVICRSKAKLRGLLPEKLQKSNHLDIKEASILDLSPMEIGKYAEDCTAVVSCLGHNVTTAGLFGQKDRRLVTESVKRLTDAMPSSAKFILMGTEGATLPGDDPRSFMERVVLFLLRNLITPHVDNEEAAAYLLSLDKESSPEWCIVRPTNLQDAEGEPASKYVLYEKPPWGLFDSSGVVTRATVALFMVRLILEPATWEAQKFHYPVIHDEPIKPETDQQAT